MVRIINAALAICCAWSISSVAWAQKTLLTAKAEKFESGLAKSWSSAGPGKLILHLDTTKEVARGKKLTTEIVKANLEDKLKAKFGVKLSILGGEKIEIAYQGSETELLKQLAKIRIRPESDVKLAAAGTVSDTGIRAKIAARDAAEGEVKLKILERSADNSWKALIIQAGPGGLPKDLSLNMVVNISGLAGSVVESSVILVKFGSAQEGVWQVQEAK